MAAINPVAGGETPGLPLVNLRDHRQKVRAGGVGVYGGFERTGRTTEDAGKRMARLGQGCGLEGKLHFPSVENHARPRAGLGGLAREQDFAGLHQFGRNGGNEIHDDIGFIRYIREGLGQRIHHPRRRTQGQQRIFFPQATQFGAHSIRHIGVDH